jgi:predicted DCC family thiol-disulfide oxidoreductase YuxK
MSDEAPTDVLVFDGECGFCTGVARWVERRLPPGAGIIPAQRVDDPSAYGLTRDDLLSAAYWIDRRRRPHRGHLAAAAALRRMGGWWGVLGDVAELPPFSWVAWAAYEVVARNRQRLPGPTPECRTEAP